MGTEKRARQKAHRAERLQAEYEEAKAQRRKRTIIRAVTIGVIVVVAVVAWNQLAGGDDDQVVIASTTTTAQPPDTTAVDSTAVDSTTTPSTSTVAAPEGVCPAEDGSSPAQTQFAAPQPDCIDPSEKYVAAFSTTLGDFEVLIDPELDEITANNFISLARFSAYDGSTFHRVINDFMVQGGDVAGLDGVGGPGYQFTGGAPEAGQYRVGSIAMANSNGPSTNGSQFFIVTGPAGAGLQPNFSLFGQVIDGIDVALAMQQVDTDDRDKPVVDVVINTIDIRVASSEDLAAYDAELAG